MIITNQYTGEMASYARWQNENIYQCCDEIGREERERDRGIFFGSIHNTLDYICAVNRSILTFLKGMLPDRNPPGNAEWIDWDELKFTH